MGAGTDDAAVAALADGDGTAVRRRGRRARPPAPMALARELRRRREALRLSLRQAARRTGVSHTVIAEIESGRRIPSLRTYERLRAELGLDPPATILLRPREPVDVLEVHLVRLAACLWACGGRIALADLAAALAIPVAAVREQLPAAGARLAACGVRVTCDGVDVVLDPLAAAAGAVAALGGLATQRRRAGLSHQAVEVLAYLGWHGEATRRQLETVRGEDCETLLGRLADAGLIAAVRTQDTGRPNLYRLTAAALQALSVASVEELRERMRPVIEGASMPAEVHAHVGSA